jgi:DNA-3-methyladenine glycosylase II
MPGDARATRGSGMGSRKNTPDAWPTSLKKAQRHLARRDPVLKRLIGTVGPCTLQLHSDRFGTLVASIISQQISTKAARSIRGRLEASLAPDGITAPGLLGLDDEQLRNVGVSANKAKSLRDLAQRVHSDDLALHELDPLDDAAVIEQLIPVRGIGVWTAQMFLIFSLGRLDVLPVADLGLRVGVQRHFGLDEPPGKAELETLADCWRPYRSIGTWYVWRSLGAVPQSQ